jgi:aryl-alcohol dehydrogenase-like predicted oxidoreductase
MAMQYTQLGQTDLHVSTVAYGTWQFGGDWGSFEAREGQAAIRHALDLGVNFFDTAQGYGFGLSERILGEALAPELKNRRESIVLATKGGLRMEGQTLVRDASGVWLGQGVEESLRNLGVDYIDIYQVHWPDHHTRLEETAQALGKLKDEGKIRYIGVSNFNTAEMDAFESVRKIDTVQPPYDLFRRDIERDILPYCQKLGIGVLVYGPMAHGLLAGRYTPQTTFSSDDWRSKNPVFQGEPFARNLAVVERLKDVARQQGITVAQLAVAWVLANPVVDVAIVGARHPQQLDETTKAADVHLTPQTMGQIEQIMRDAVPMSGPTPEAM